MAMRMYLSKKKKQKVLPYLVVIENISSIYRGRKRNYYDRLNDHQYINGIVINLGFVQRYSLL